MEGASQKPVLHITPDQDLSDVIVRSIRDHCGMKGCTIKEIQKLIHGTYAVEIADDLDLFRLIIVSCKKSIKHGRLFKHGCKYRVSFSEFSLDPPSNGATLVADKSSEKSTLFVCELCKENGEGRQAASLSANAAKECAQSESVWMTTDSSKRCCLCRTHISSPAAVDKASTNSSMLDSSLVSDTEIVSSVAINSSSIPFKNALGNEEHSLKASATMLPSTSSFSNDASHVKQNCTSTSPPNTPNRYTTRKGANCALKLTAQNPESTQTDSAMKPGKNSGSFSPDAVENRDGAKARKTKNRRTQVKFLTDGLTPFYSSDGKRKRPSLATSSSPVTSKLKKCRLSLDSAAASRDPAPTTMSRAEWVSLKSSGAVNLARFTMVARSKKKWQCSSENHGTYQLVRGVKEDILFPHITEDDVKMFELARSLARQCQQQSKSSAPNSPRSEPDQLAVLFSQDEEGERSVQPSQKHRGACPDLISERASLSRLEGNGMDGVQALCQTDCSSDQVERKHPSDKPEFEMPGIGSNTLVDNVLDNSADNDGTIDDDFTDDVDDNIDNSESDNNYVKACVVDSASDNRKGLDNTCGSPFGESSLMVKADGASKSNKGEDSMFDSSSGNSNTVDKADNSALVITACDNSSGNTGCMDSAAAITCDTFPAFEKSDEQTAFEKSDVTNHEGETDHPTVTTADNNESGCTAAGVVDSCQSAGIRDSGGSVVQPSCTAANNCSFSENGAELGDVSLFDDHGNSMMNDIVLVPAAKEDVVEARNTSNKGLSLSEQSFNGESTLDETFTVDNLGEQCLQEELVSGSISDSVAAVQPSSVQADAPEALLGDGQNMVTANFTSGKTSAVTANHNAAEENEIGETCSFGSESGEPDNCPAEEALSLTGAESLICSAATSELNSSTISISNADIRAESDGPDVMNVPSKLEHLEHDKPSFVSEDQCSENMASNISSLLIGDVLKTILDISEKNDVAAQDADLATLPSKRNRKRKRFFCPDGCCSLSDSHNVASKSDEHPVKPKVGCPKGAKQKLSPQPAEMPKIPRPRGRPRKNPVPTRQDEPSHTDTVLQATVPSLTRNASSAAISMDQMVNHCNRPENSVQADNKSVANPHSLDLSDISAVSEELNADECLPLTSVSDAVLYRNHAEQDSSGDDDVANAFDSEDESLTNCAVTQEVCADVPAALGGILSTQTADLGVKTFEKNANQGDLLSTDVIETNLPQFLGNVPEDGANVPEDVGNVLLDGMNVSQGIVNVPQGGVNIHQSVVNEASVSQCNILSDVLIQVDQVQGKVAESCDMVTGSHELEICVQPAQVYEKDILSCGPVANSFEPQMIIKDTHVLEKDVHTCSTRSKMLQSEMITEVSHVLGKDVQTCSMGTDRLEPAKLVEASLDKDVQTCSMETETLEAKMVIETACVLEQNALSPSIRSDSFVLAISTEVTPMLEKGVQSCNVVTGGFESEIVLKAAHVTEKENHCRNSVTENFELQLSDVVVAHKGVENDLHSVKAVPDRSVTELVETNAYHYINSAPQVVGKNEHGSGIAVSNSHISGIAVSNSLTAEIISKSEPMGVERPNLVERNLYQCAITQECRVQNTEVLLGSNVATNNCHQHLANGVEVLVPDTSLPSAECHLQAANNLLHDHDCYMPLNNLSTDCHIQVPVEFQVEADSQIQLTVMPPDSRVHVLSDSSEALMRLVNPSLTDCHLQLNSITPDVCAISDHQFTHAPGTNTVFCSQNEGFGQTCVTVPNHRPQPDSSATFLNTSCIATAPMQTPTSASNFVGSNIQDGTWPVQPSNLLYALPLQAPAPLSNFGRVYPAETSVLNFGSNVMYALPIQSMVTGMNFDRSDPQPESGTAAACSKPEAAHGSPSSSGPCPVHAQGARGLVPQLLGCQPYIIICPGSLPISSILQPLSESLGQILPYICSPTDPRHLSCHSSVLGNFVSPVQQYSWGMPTQNASAPGINVGQFVKTSTERNPAADLFVPLPGHHQQQAENEPQNAMHSACSSAHGNQAFTSVNASQLIADSLLTPQFVMAQNLPVPLGISSNHADLSSIPVQVHSSGFIFPQGK